MPGLTLVQPRENFRGDIIHCPTCHYVHVVPPDCPVAPVCPRCLYQDQVEEERVLPVWFWVLLWTCGGLAVLFIMLEFVHLNQGRIQ